MERGPKATISNATAAILAVVEPPRMYMHKPPGCCSWRPLALNCYLGRRFHDTLSHGGTPVACTRPRPQGVARGAQWRHKTALLVLGGSLTTCPGRFVLCLFRRLGADGGYFRILHAHTRPASRSRRKGRGANRRTAHAPTPAFGGDSLFFLERMNSSWKETLPPRCRLVSLSPVSISFVFVVSICSFKRESAVLAPRGARFRACIAVAASTQHPPAHAAGGKHLSPPALPLRGDGFGGGRPGGCQNRLHRRHYRTHQLR